MADDSMKISGPVKIEDNSRERVAYDLTLQIARHDKVPNEVKDRKYWFTLYRQCHLAASGCNLAAILKEE